MGLAAVAVPAIAVAGVLLAAWPATLALVAIVGLGLLLAWRTPPLALVLGLLMLGFEGSIKVLLRLEETPLPGGPRAAGAAAIDIVLFAGVLAVLLGDRGRTPRALWRGLARGERVVVGVLVAWLAVSVPQIAQNADLGHGVAGFRLFHAYLLVGVAVAVLFTVPWLSRRGTVVLLGLGVATGLYAVARVVAGPSPAEVALVRDTSATTMDGSTLRAFGSFSGAVGMNSYLLPLALFGLVLGLLVPRLRLLGWAVAGLSVAPIAASHARTPLLGFALGLAVMVAVLLSASGVSSRRKVAILAAAVLAVGVVYGAILLGSHGTPHLRERAHGILHPLDDVSMRQRLDHWERAIDQVTEKPLGRGVGKEGGSAGRFGLAARTPDNSFLKVFVDQGVPMGVAFLVGLLALVFAIARRLRRIEGEPRALGLAALTGFVGFVGLCLSGETVEQPGKAIAWSLLGIAFVMALAVAPAPALAGWDPSPWLAAVRRRIAAPGARRAWIALAAALVLVSVAVTLGRAPGFEASVDLTPHPAGPFPPATRLQWYTHTYAEPAVRERIARTARMPGGREPFKAIRLARAGRGARMSARLGSPEGARRFVRAVAGRVVSASQRGMVLWAQGGRAGIARALRTHVSRSRRRTLRAQMKIVTEVARERPKPVTAGGVAVTPGRWGDRVVGAIPGFGSARPGAVWVAVAGLVVVLALWLGTPLLEGGGRRVGMRRDRRP